MSKLVLLNLGRGTLQEGFPSVTVQLKEEGNDKSSQFNGSLPAASNILHLYRRWQLLYDLLYQAKSIYVGLRQLRQNDSDIQFDEDDVTHVSEVDFYNICQELQKQIDNWLDFEDFRHIDRQLRLRLTPDEEIRFIIQTEDNNLRNIPLHIWRFFRDYQKSEIALSSIEFESVLNVKKTIKRVKILAILGDSTGIDVNADKKLLSALPDAQTVFLVEPSRQELDEKLWDKQGWDILFFAGHSSSKDDDETGYIYANYTEKIEISQLKNALKKARQSGLQLAIFNSCDGLGLAQQLDDLHIPQIIIMREPVPDKVAQEFLKYFLSSFSNGESLYLAFREAREKLQGLEGNFPGASWLPVLFQNPAEISPTWKSLQGKETKNHQHLFKSRHKSILNFPTILITSLTITSLITGARWLGVLQHSELQAYDHLMMVRSQEEPDARILVVGIKDEDLQLPEQKLRRKNTHLSDEALEKLLQKLYLYNSKLIGLDVIRDFPVDAKYKELKVRLKNSDRIYGGCYIGDAEKNHSFLPPPEIQKNYLGFMDVLAENSDGDVLAEQQNSVVRRHILSRDLHPTSVCKLDTALSLLLASDYLQQKGFNIKINGNWQIGNVVFHRLQIPTGGYQKADMWGNQILLNYRSYRSPNKIVDIVSLTDVLRGKINPELVKDRIVLVGVMTSKSEDRHRTPYNQTSSPKQDMPGVILQAQMLSQILSAVLDKRPLIWVLPFWGEFLWVWSWSIVSGVLVWRRNSIYYLIISTTVVCIVLYSICFALFQPSISCWIPLVPPIFALAITEGTLVVFILVNKSKNLTTT